jgi:hypothetical protein
MIYEYSLIQQRTDSDYSSSTHPGIITQPFANRNHLNRHISEYPDIDTEDIYEISVMDLSVFHFFLLCRTVSKHTAAPLFLYPSDISYRFDSISEHFSRGGTAL